MSLEYSEKGGVNHAPVDRESARHYIPASTTEIEEMLQSIGLQDLAGLYSHIPADSLFAAAPDLPDELGYEDLRARMEALSQRNATRLSFLGDGLPDFSVDPIVGVVSEIRNLTTAYTPYQPERAQGTLYAHWVYQSLLSQITGFEAISSSLYDRSSAVFEAVQVALRLKRGTDAVLLPVALYPGDREVVHTLAQDTGIRIVETPLDPATGRIDKQALEASARALGKSLAAIVFPQVNSLGLLEEVDALTDLAHAFGALAITVVDPLHLFTGGLKAPVDFGANGADMIVGEAQHLAIAPNFGGPGLGLFGIRHHEKEKNAIRQTPGRYVGRAHDLAGRDCRVMVLSTREQHIRKDKATSNICSNQAFLATLAGASLLARGEIGTQQMLEKARTTALLAADRLSALPGVELAFPQAPFLNEITLRLDRPVDALIEAARSCGLHLGADVSERLEGSGNLLKISFSDRHDEDALHRLMAFFENVFGSASSSHRLSPPEIPAHLRRAQPVGLANLPRADIEAWYQHLGSLNCSPDDAPYPLGSCTMKYNPRINDWAAGLPGFTDIHPQAPIADAQGSLEVLYEIQEWFKLITGLPGVTTQPLAGAQGELVGIKLFQAYFRDRGETQRDVILIPSSAHGTNFATAVMAGFHGKTVVDGKRGGIVYLDADESGQIDLAQLDRILADYGTRVAGVMITNPNTSGLFETRFRAIADRIHALGGLMYMDGANMNAIAGWVDLGAMGVDAVHNNLHKTWTIPHGGGGPGDAFVAVSDKLIPFLPGLQIERREDGSFAPVRPPKSIGSFHRHWGNFAHKVRALTYLYRLGKEGVPRMSAMAVLSARYLYDKLRHHYPVLPRNCVEQPRMHEFILTLAPEDFARAEAAGVPMAAVLARVGKLFLDFGYHAPTMSWPETYGMMIEPTESYTKTELDRFAEVLVTLLDTFRTRPEVLQNAPRHTPVDRIDDVAANRQLILNETIRTLPALPCNRRSPEELLGLSPQAIRDLLLQDTLS